MPTPADERAREIMRNQLIRRRSEPRDPETRLGPRRDAILQDMELIRDSLPEKGMRTVIASVGTVTLYGE